MSLLTADSRRELDRINQAVNEAIHSGERATSYDRAHRYDEEEQHEYPTRVLVSESWAPGGYGRVLEVGAGTGYFTALIASRAESVIALEPVPDLRKILEARCEAEGLMNVKVTGFRRKALPVRAPAPSIPRSSSRACIICIAGLTFEAPTRGPSRGPPVHGRAPSQRAPAARLLRHYLMTYRARDFWTDERNYHARFRHPRRASRPLPIGRIPRRANHGHRIPYTRRFIEDPVAR
jgi:SAM-dependent methyltransferase